MVEAITRHWGNSIGVIIPKNIVEEQKIEPNMQVDIEIKPLTDLKSLRGLVKFSANTQQIKNEMRKGWK